MKLNNPAPCTQSPAPSNKGQVLVLFVMFFVLVMSGVAGTVIDLGFIYREKVRMATAADAGALAGALQLPSTTSADAKAKQYASRNSYTDGQNGVTITTYPVPPDKFKVEIQKPVRHYFMQLLGITTTDVKATATAQYYSLQPINIWGTGTYGTVGTQSLEISGPKGIKSYGDPYATEYTGTGYTPNSEYDPSGYSYCMNIPSNYSTINGTTNVSLELFDATSGTSACTSCSPCTGCTTPSGWNDEVYTAHGTSTQATTEYSIYAPDATPNDTTDDVLVSTVSIGPGNCTYKCKWATPPGFTFNSNTYGTGCYRVNVKTPSGSGGNAYHMRAGPGGAFNPANGTSIDASGSLQMFFQTSGTVNMSLGTVPSSAAGMNLHINKFDTDVGALSVNYNDSPSPALINTNGVLSTNGTWREDVLTIPSGYPGGTLKASYSAGADDTSIWNMWYEGALPGQPGHVKLVD